MSLSGPGASSRSGLSGSPQPGGGSSRPANSSYDDLTSAFGRASAQQGGGAGVGGAGGGGGGGGGGPGGAASGLGLGLSLGTPGSLGVRTPSGLDPLSLLPSQGPPSQTPSLSFAELQGLFANADLAKFPGLASGLANLPSLSNTIASGDLEGLLLAHSNGTVGAGAGALSGAGGQAGTHGAYGPAAGAGAGAPGLGAHNPSSSTLSPLGSVQLPNASLQDPSSLSGLGLGGPNGSLELAPRDGSAGGGSRPALDPARESSLLDELTVVEKALDGPAPGTRAARGAAAQGVTPACRSQLTGRKRQPSRQLP